MGHEESYTKENGDSSHIYTHAKCYCGPQRAHHACRHYTALVTRFIEYTKKQFTAKCEYIQSVTLTT